MEYSSPTLKYSLHYKGRHCIELADRIIGREFRPWVSSRNKKWVDTPSESCRIVHDIPYSHALLLHLCPKYFQLEINLTLTAMPRWHTKDPSIIISKSESRDSEANPLLFSLTTLWRRSRNIHEATQRLFGASQEYSIIIALSLCSAFNQASFSVLKSHHLYAFPDLCELAVS